MKVVRHPSLIGVAVGLLFAAVSSVAAEDEYYVTTDLLDPLQPVWDAVDRVPDAVVRAIQAQLSVMKTQIDNKMESLTQKMTTLLQSHNRVEQSVNSRGNGVNDHINEQMTYFQQFYETHYLADLEAAVSKIELHVNTQFDALETKLETHINTKFASLSVSRGRDNDRENTSDVLSRLYQSVQRNTITLGIVNTHVLKIIENLGGSSEGGDSSCSTMLDKVEELMQTVSSAGGKVCPTVNQMSLPFGQPGDCSDIHWQHPELPSGVYEIFPTQDHKAPVNVFCDMGLRSAKNTGGWTVILRRRNTTYGLENFNRTWSDYRRGFGAPGEGEWWFGLSSLHALTYRQPYVVDLLFHDMETGAYHAQYTSFRVDDEAHNYTLIVNGFSGNLTHDALASKHHGSSFSTWDRDNDGWGTGNCGQSNGGGWWFNNCHFTTLTAPFPTSNDRQAKTIRWLEDDWLVLNDVTMKIRPHNYAERFNDYKTG